MTKADRERFAKAMAIMAIAIDREPNEERTEVYWKFLKDLHIEDIERSIQHIIKNKKIPTFPTIGEIRTLIVQEEDERLDLDASLAWREATQRVFAGDYLNDDSLLDKAVRLAFGSWGSFGRSSEKDEPWDRRHFIHIYKLLGKQEFRQLETGIKIMQALEHKPRSSPDDKMKFKRGGPYGKKEDREGTTDVTGEKKASARTEEKEEKTE